MSVVLFRPRLRGCTLRQVVGDGNGSPIERLDLIGDAGLRERFTNSLGPTQVDIGDHDIGPARAKCKAIAHPMPRVAPVTTAVFPFSCTPTPRLLRLIVLEAPANLMLQAPECFIARLYSVRLGPERWLLKWNLTTIEFPRRPYNRR